ANVATAFALPNEFRVDMLSQFPQGRREIQYVTACFICFVIVIRILLNGVAILVGFHLFVLPCFSAASGLITTSRYVAMMKQCIREFFKLQVCNGVLHLKFSYVMFYL